MNCLEKKVKKTELITVKELFSNTKYGQNIFIVPDYQRGYAWDSQFEDLWKDILRIYINGDPSKQHYTGMLSLEEMNKAQKKNERVEDANAFYIVDGQQRLTSIVIILKALFSYIKEENGEDLESDILSISDSTYRFDYSVTRDDQARKFFTDRIYLGSNTDDFSDMYLKNIDRAKKYIDECLIKFNVKQAKQLLDIVLNRLVFNIYFVMEDFDVRVTFETMNNRGKKLSNLELLKNRLMYLTTFVGKKDLGNANYENRLKDKINVAWKNIYKNLCYVDHQLNDDEYLRQHWIVYATLDKRTGDAYIKDILDKKFSIDNGDFYDLVSNKKYKDAYNFIYRYVDSLETYSKFWGLINNPIEKRSLVSNQAEIERLDRLNRIGTNRYIKSTIMVLTGESSIDSDLKIKAYKALEKSVFINKVLYGTWRNDYSAIIKDARALLNAKESDKITAYHTLFDSIKSGEIKIDDELIKIAIRNLGDKLNNSNGFFYSWDGIRYVLYEYDTSLKFKTDKTIIWDSINADSIEHILPQTPDKRYWEIVLSPIKDDEDKIKKITNSLGNLLLLSKDENSSLQNFSYPVKRKTDISTHKFAYSHGSKSAQEVAENENWFLTNIQQREDKLVRFIYQNWIKDVSSLSLNDFADLMKNVGLLIGNQNNPSDELILELNRLTYDDEMPKAEKVKSTNREWYDALKNYFSSDYEVQLNSKQLRYLENKFSFKKNGSIISCGISQASVKYYLRYSIDDGVLKIAKETPDGWLWLFDDTDLPHCVTYFIDTFNRYLRRYCNKKEVHMFVEADENDQSKKADATYYTEKEFLEKRSSFDTDVIQIYKNLKTKIEELYKNQPLRITKNYVAYFCNNHQFAQIHIRTDRVTVLVKDSGIQSNLINKLPDDPCYDVLKYEINIKNNNQIDEAMKLITASFNQISFDHK